MWSALTTLILLVVIVSLQDQRLLMALVRLLLRFNALSASIELIMDPSDCLSQFLCITHKSWRGSCISFGEDVRLKMVMQVDLFVN